MGRFLQIDSCVRAGVLSDRHSKGVVKPDIPMVVMKLGVQASSQNLSKRHDFPTPAEVIGQMVSALADHGWHR